MAMSTTDLPNPTNRLAQVADPPQTAEEVKAKAKLTKARLQKVCRRRDKVWRQLTRLTGQLKPADPLNRKVLGTKLVEFGRASVAARQARATYMESAQRHLGVIIKPQLEARFQQAQYELGLAALELEQAQSKEQAALATAQTAEDKLTSAADKVKQVAEEFDSVNPTTMDGLEAAWADYVVLAREHRRDQSLYHRARTRLNRAQAQHKRASTHSDRVVARYSRAFERA